MICCVPDVGIHLDHDYAGPDPVVVERAQLHPFDGFAEHRVVGAGTTSVGDGRTSIWMDASIPLAFEYSGGRVPIVNREWLDILTASAR